MRAEADEEEKQQKIAQPHQSCCQNIVKGGGRQRDALGICVVAPVAGATGVHGDHITGLHGIALQAGPLSLAADLSPECCYIVSFFSQKEHLVRGDGVKLLLEGLLILDSL